MAIAYFSTNGYIVSIPLNDTQDYDLIVEKDNLLQKVIEDSYETCRELMDNGIKSILMTTKMNADIETKEIVRVNNWDEIYEEYEQIAKFTNGNISYSGNAFINFHRKFPDIDLYEDKQHPTLVGAYLSACCLYDTIYNKPSIEVEYYDVLNSKIAIESQKVADKTILKLK